MIHVCMPASANLENTTVKMLQFALTSNGEYIEDCIDWYTDFLYPKMYWQINIWQKLHLNTLLHEKLLHEGLWKARGNYVYWLISFVKQSMKTAFQQI